MLKIVLITTKLDPYILGLRKWCFSFENPQFLQFCKHQLEVSAASCSEHHLVNDVLTLW